MKRRPQDEQRLAAFGARTRAARTAQGMSQDGLAEAAGLHRTYIGGVERGERNASLLNVYAIADALGIEVSVLFEGLPGTQR